jgi:hypothetical protein
MIENSGEPELRQRMAEFFPKFIYTVNFDQIDLFTTLDGSSTLILLLTPARNPFPPR